MSPISEGTNGYMSCIPFLQEHSCVLHSIVGWDCVLGAWSRIEGYPSDLNPNDPVARIPSESLFNIDGRLNPSITILGKCVWSVHVHHIPYMPVTYCPTCTCTCSL